MRFKTGYVTQTAPSWWLYGERNEIVAWAGETFDCVALAESAAEQFRLAAARAKVELFQDRAGQWRWRAYVHGTRVASSTEAYTSEIAARRAATSVKTTVGRTPLRLTSSRSLRRAAD